MGPREVPWQSCWEAFKGFKGCWKRAGWQFRSSIETGCSASQMPDSSCEAQQKHCQMAVSNRNSSWGLGKSHGKAAGRVLKGFKGCWERAGWHFRSPIETGCSASEMPDSSFEAQQKHCQMAVSNRNSSWGLGKSHGKAAGRVLRILRLLETCRMAVSKPNRNRL